MRILLVVHGFPPQALGGTEIHTYDLAQALHRHLGEEVFVLARESVAERKEYAVRESTQDGLRIFFINNTFRETTSFEETYRNPRIRAEALRVVEQIQPDVVHIQHLTCLSTDLILDFAHRRLPTYLTLNDYWLLCHRGQLFDLDGQRCSRPANDCRRCLDSVAGLPAKVRQAAPFLRRVEASMPLALAQKWRRSVTRLVHPLTRRQSRNSEIARRSRHMRKICDTATLLLAPSDTLREKFLEFGLEPDQIRYQEQGIDTTPFVGAFRKPADRLRIGYLGSLSISKAPHLLLEAFLKLPPEAATLEVYGEVTSYHGDDTYGQLIAPLLEQPGVHFHGPTPHSQVPRALANIDVLVVPSVWLENAPFVIREAFAAGVPVVASDLGGMAEMVEHEVSGLRFKPEDICDLYKTLQRLLDEPELLAKLRTGIPKMKTIEEEAVELRELYQAALTIPTMQRRPRRSNRIAAVVLNYCTPQDTVLAVRSLQSSVRPVQDILVVDNGSNDGSEEFLREHLPLVEILQTGSNLGFPGGSNVGIRTAIERGADLVLLVNADAMVAPNCLGHLEDALEGHVAAGIAGPVILAAEDPSRVNSTGITFSPGTGRMRHLGEGEIYRFQEARPTRVTSGVAGCLMLIKKQVFDQIGLLDEGYFFSYEDLDFCLRASRSGYQTLCVGDAIAYHLGSRSIGERSVQRLYFGARNHLLLCQQSVMPAKIPRWYRSSCVLALNLAYVLRGSGYPRVAGVAAVLRGTRDYLRKRFRAPPQAASE